MKVFVTGSTGFIGKNLVGFLSEKGYELELLLRRESRVDSIREVLSQRSNIRVSMIDSNWAKSMGSDDCVVYLGGLQAGRGVSDEEYFEANTSRAKEFILSCPDNIGLFVYVSTIRVYGEYGEERIDEASEYRGASRYARSKILVERFLEERGRENGFRYCILQPTFVYGPEDANGLMSKLLALARRGIFPLIDGGRNVLNFIHIDDLAAVVEAIIKMPDRCVCKKFIVGFPQDVSVADLFQLVKSLANRRIVAIRMPRRFALGLTHLSVIDRSQVDTLTGNVKVNTDRIYSCLGIYPQIEIQGGLSRILAENR